MIPLLYLVMLIAGLSLMVISSHKAVEYAEELALSLGVPSVLIGLFIFSIGTDLPEIANSVIASISGHGDINVGDSLGSCLTQITLALGLLPFFGKFVRVDREEVLVMGSAVLLSLLLSLSLMEDGFVSRENALFLIISAFLLLNLSGKGLKNPGLKPKPASILHALILLISLIGVGIGAYMVVSSIIFLSNFMHISEYFISFFVTSAGTSLPELAVGVVSVKKRKHGLALGNILGSNIVDATFAIGAGPLIRPVSVSTILVESTGWYIFWISFLVLSLLWWRRKVDKKCGAFLICLYLMAYLFLLQG